MYEVVHGFYGSLEINPPTRNAPPMAQNATIYKVRLSIADISRHYYDELKLTIARHPSETEERAMVRLLAYALHAAPELQFARGLSTDDEPDLWLKTPSGDIDLWIDVGLPAADRVRKACNRARSVFIYSYGGRTAALWWRQNEALLERFSNLGVINLAPQSTGAITRMADRNMALRCTVDDDTVCLSDATEAIYVEYQPLKPGPHTND